MVRMVITPLQTDGRRGDHKFVLEDSKSLRRETFGKQVSKLINTRHKGHCNMFLKNFFPDKMVVNLYVLSVSMKERIRSKRAS